MTQGYRAMDSTTKTRATMSSSSAARAAPSSNSDDARRDNVLILGLRKAGKSSSFQVVYESLNPEDALQEGVTQAHKSEPYNVDTFHRMRIWDGTSNFTSSSSSTTNHTVGQQQLNQVGQKYTQAKSTAASQPAVDGGDNGKGKAAFGTGDQLYWTECSAVIFVVDSQGEYSEALDRLNDVILSAYAHNPLIHFHVFVHKADGHSSDYRNDTLQDIQQRVADNLQDSSPSFFFAPTAQEILAEAAAAQDTFGQNQQQVPADGDQQTNSAMYYSTSSVGRYNAMQSNFTAAGLPSAIGHELDHDVRLSFHVTSILDCSINIAWSRVQMDLMNVEVFKTLESICNGLCNSSKLEKVYLFDVPSKTYISADGSPFDEATFEVISDYITFLVRFSGLYSNIKQQQNQHHQTEGSSAERYSTSTLRLAPDTTLCFHQICGNLALVYVVRNDLQAKNAGMIEYNVSIARRAIIDTYAVYTFD